MALTNYQTQLQDILNDPNAYFYPLAQLKGYINRARQIIARETQCVRVMPVPYGTVASYAVTAGGSGYLTPPTVTISGPDAMGAGFVNATATSTLAGNAVSAVNVVLAGTGYVNAPTVTFTSVSGSGAKATATLTSFVHTNANQEVYSYSTFNTILAANNPGVKSIVGIQSVAVSWGSQKPILDQVPFSLMQAYMRSASVTTTNFPLVWSQYGQGETGSLYLFPIPQQVSQMELDCYCVPVDLADDTTAEAIPDPFTDSICFLSAYYAYMNAQRQDAAALMTAEYKRFVREARASVQPAVVPSFYAGD